MGPYASTADQFLVKAFNQGIVLHLLRVQGPLSRADIAKVTGLNKTTVSVLVEELIHRHLVQEVGMGASSGGRRPMLLTLNARAGFVVGADLGVDYFLVVVLDLQAQPIWKRRVHRVPGTDPSTDVRQLADLIADGVAAVSPTPLGLLGIGVGVHGPVEHPGGRLLFAPNLGWTDVPVGELLRERFQVPIVVDNEANAGALSELWYAAQDADTLFYFSVGMGLGTGIVINGEIYRGAAGTAGEFGHTTIDPSGPPCTCGNRGCLETFVSERALMRYLQGSGAEKVATTQEVFQAADAGEARAISALAQLGGYLGIGVANAINTFNPQLVVIGGPIGSGGHHVLNSVRRVVERRALPFPLSRARIVVSALGEEACAIGAGIMILQEFFRIPQVKTAGERTPEAVLGGLKGGRGQQDPMAWPGPDGAHYSTVKSSS
ncbi:ROK family transcriptional regulator [Limnochorda pilosa]|uniref:Glucokinase n=1 Tax=Limnochorda pilosa TaxID=1555112 RepID=A0A0K2SLG3_LIMPI|nr:ROK family protein [Limnochorda pilosa]BAS27966.1 glucokinase [Limnochorda pilosa]